MAQMGTLDPPCVTTVEFVSRRSTPRDCAAKHGLGPRGWSAQWLSARRTHADMKNMKERTTNLDIAHGSERSATDIASGSGSRGNEAGRPLSVRQSSTQVVAREGSAGRLAP